MNRHKVFNAVVMVTGTSIGTGILGLPIVTSTAGIIPSMLAFILAWVFMTLGAYYILQVKLQRKGSHNLSHLIKLTLGRQGQYIASLMILLLLYALLCTYTMAGSAWLTLFAAPLVALPSYVSAFLFIALLGAIVSGGDRITYNLNNILGLGLLFAFVATVASSFVPSSTAFVQQGSLEAIFPSLPLILTTFGFSIVVPALTEYLDYDEKSVKTAIILGSLVALAAYAVWEWVTLGNIALEGPISFSSMKQHGDDGTGVIVALAASARTPWVVFSGRLFAIFAVTTSFLGVSLALLHFLSDALKSFVKSRWLLFMVAYVPPMLITCLYPKAFIQVLSLAGIFVAVLLGLFPVLMVFKQNTCVKTRAVHVIVILFFVLVILQEVINLME